MDRGQFDALARLISAQRSRRAAIATYAGAKTLDATRVEGNRAQTAADLLNNNQSARITLTNGSKVTGNLAGGGGTGRSARAYATSAR